MYAGMDVPGMRSPKLGGIPLRSYMWGLYVLMTQYVGDFWLPASRLAVGRFPRPAFEPPPAAFWCAPATLGTTRRDEPRPGRTRGGEFSTP